MTVTGPVDTQKMGITLSHDHLFIDLRNQFTEFKDPEKQRISRQILGMENLGTVRLNPHAIKDNLVLDDVELAIQETQRFKTSGGSTIVDCTSAGINRNPGKLREVALRTGLNIVAGCGYYTHDTHPAEMDGWSAEEIADRMVGELTVGIDGTDIKAGVIGEIGTSNPIHPNERKNLVATGLAFKQTGAAVQVHTDPWGRFGLEIVDLLINRGGIPPKIVICHADVQIDLPYIRSLLKREVFVEFDNFGKEFYVDRLRTFSRDIERVRTIKTLLNEGYEKQILITNDICLKSMLHRYGGWGYDHILNNIVPMMCEQDIDAETINLFLQDNPRRLYEMSI